MNYLLFSGSLRTASLNKKLIHVGSSILKEKNFNAEVIDLKTLSIPVYDGDIEAEGIPEGVKKLSELVNKADGIIISGPEYNGSISGSLKNTIDWVSRIRPIPWEKKTILLMGASPGYFGAIRALGVSKAPFETLGAYVFPQTFALPKASEAFTESGDLSDVGTKKKLTDLIMSFDSFSRKFKKD